MIEYISKEDLKKALWRKNEYELNIFQAYGNAMQIIENFPFVTKADMCKEFTQKFVDRLNYQTKIPHSFAIFVNETISEVLAEMEKDR